MTYLDSLTIFCLCGNEIHFPIDGENETKTFDIPCPVCGQFHKFKLTFCF